MRIRFFNTYEPVTPTYRDLLPFLAGQGIEVEIILSDQEYRPGRRPLEEILQHPGIHIHRVRSGLPIRGRSSLVKLWVMVTYVLGAMKRSLLGPPADLNFFFTQPPLFFLWGYFLRRFRGQPYICQVMDIYPDVAVQNGLMKEKALATRSLTKLSRFALQQADTVIVIGRCQAGRLRQDGIPETKLCYIPNWVSATEVFPISPEHNQLRRSLKVNGSFVILYSGNLGVSHYFDDIILAAERLRDQPGIQFVFIGDGPRRSELELARDHLRLNNLRLLPFQQADRLSESLSLGNAHFVSLRADFEGLVVPSKAYSALGVGQPIIYQGAASSEIAQMIKEEGIGTVVPLGDADALTEAILRYKDNPTLAQEQGARALILNRGKFGRSCALEKYLALFQRFQEVPSFVDRMKTSP